MVLLERAAVVGLPGEAGERHAVTGEVDGELFGQEGGVGLGEFVGVAGEGDAADDLADAPLELVNGHIAGVYDQRRALLDRFQHEALGADRFRIDHGTERQEAAV